jgi:hypothetical protein
VAPRLVPVEDYRWEQAEVPLDTDDLLTGIASTPVGWVAVGVHLNFPDETTEPVPGADPFADLYSGAVWTSPDGRAWTRQPDAPVFDGARMTKVLATERGALAFGLGGVCLPDACSGLPPNGGTIVWRSGDGASWERLEDTGVAGGAVVDAVRVGQDLVAVGFVANDGSKPDGDPFSNPTDAAIWRSPDGVAWEAVLELPAADRLARVWVEDEILVVLGEGAEGIVVWTSADGGNTWLEAPGLSDFCCVSEVYRGKVFVASSRHENGAQAVLHTLSLPGGSWDQAPLGELRGFRLVHIEAIGESLVAFGWHATLGADGLLVDRDPRTFASTDGASWASAIVPDGWDRQAPVATAYRGHQVAVILRPMDTLNGPRDDQAATIWLGTAGG